MLKPISFEYTLYQLLTELNSVPTDRYTFATLRSFNDAVIPKEASYRVLLVSLIALPRQLVIFSPMATGGTVRPHFSSLTDYSVFISQLAYASQLCAVSDAIRPPQLFHIFVDNMNYPTRIHLAPLTDVFVDDKRDQLKCLWLHECLETAQ